MLPDGFRWQSIYGASDPRGRDGLACLGYEVARLVERTSGGWLAILRYPDGRIVSRSCSSQEAGRQGIVAWATRHQDALRAHCRTREREWLAKQSWRKD